MSRRKKPLTVVDFETSSLLSPDYRDRSQRPAILVEIKEPTDAEILATLDRKGDIYRAVAERLKTAWISIDRATRAIPELATPYAGTRTGRFKPAGPVMQAQSPKPLPAPEIPSALVDYERIERRALVAMYGTDPALFLGVDLARPGSDMTAVVIRHPNGRLEVIEQTEAKKPLTQDRVSKRRKRRKRRCP